MNSSMNREEFLAPPPLRIEKVFLPERGEGKFVFVRELTGEERDEFENSNLRREKDKKRGLVTYDVEFEAVRARLVVKGLCNESGARLLQDGDLDAVKRMGAGVISKLYNVIAALSGITDEDVQDLLKN